MTFLLREMVQYYVWKAQTDMQVPCRSSELRLPTEPTFMYTVYIHVLSHGCGCTITQIV